MIKLVNRNIYDLKKHLQGKKLYCFGSGKQPEGFFKKYESLHFEDDIDGFIDNDENKKGKKKLINEKEFVIFSFQDFLEKIDKNTVILTTSMYFPYMINQMDKESRLDNIECYIDFFVDYVHKGKEISWTVKIEQKIPKKIHYCWFGGKELPQKFYDYIETWKQQCSDYEIIRWDESNYDITACNYVKQAYKHKKWAFVSDYARLDIIYNNGGIYLDTDVELVRNLDDLLYDEFFCGFEQNNYINFGLGFGAIKGHKILENLLKKYNSMEFELENGELNQTACAVYQLEELVNQGFRVDNIYQCKNGIAVYPSEVFAPYDLLGLKNHITENTYSIHHYSSTWWDDSAAESMRYLKNNLYKYVTRMEQINI